MLKVGWYVFGLDNKNIYIFLVVKKGGVCVGKLLVVVLV